MYNYTISFLWTNSFDRTTEYSSIYVKVEEKHITYENIIRFKWSNNIPENAVVLAVSYLGEYE